MFSLIWTLKQKNEEKILRKFLRYVIRGHSFVDIQSATLTVAELYEALDDYLKTLTDS